MAGKTSKQSRSSKRSAPTNPPPLPSEEWDFANVADIDLPACYLWEYWREKCFRDPSIANALDGLREDVRADDNAIRRYDQTELSVFRYLVETKAPGITQAHAESLEMYGKFNLYLWSSVNPLSTEMDGLANVSEEYFPCRAFLSLEPTLKQIIRGFASPRNSKGQHPPLEEISTPHSVELNQPRHAVECVSFQVNWDHNDAVIEEAFHEWVRLSRGNRKASITKGLGPGRSITKTFLKDLKALGAMRLLAYYKSGPAAMDALKKIKRSLFSDKADWFKAKKHAESVLQDFKILSD